MAKKSDSKKKQTPWDSVQLARNPGRPNIYEYIRLLCSDFTELHGDRLFGDDRGMVCGFATMDKQKMVVIGHHKGKTVEENIAANFGMASPEGYRKAMRVMKLAEKFHLPVVTFVDTPGAYPGADAEARGQAEAIAHNLEFMAGLKTPIVVVVIGEGGSGGALGIAVGDRVFMLEHAVYSVISPEGCASILWRDGAKAPEAAAALKITSSSLKELKVIDGVIPEPAGGAHTDHQATAAAVKKTVLAAIKELSGIPVDQLVDQRYEKFRAMGRFF